MFVWDYLHFVNHFWQKHKALFIQRLKVIISVSLTIHKNWSWINLQHIFWWQSAHAQYKGIRLFQISHSKHFRENTLSKKIVFLKIQLQIHCWPKCQKNTILVKLIFFFNTTIWKLHSSPIESEHYPFNLRSNAHMNWVDWIFLHPK